MVRRPILSFIDRSSNIGRGRRLRPIITASANKRQYWSTDHPVFVIFFTKNTTFFIQEYHGKKRLRVGMCIVTKSRYDTYHRYLV